MFCSSHRVSRIVRKVWGVQWAAVWRAYCWVFVVSRRKALSLHPIIRLDVCLARSLDPRALLHVLSIATRPPSLVLAARLLVAP